MIPVLFEPVFVGITPKAFLATGAQHRIISDDNHRESDVSPARPATN